MEFCSSREGLKISREEHGLTLHLPVFKTGDVPLLALCKQRHLYSEGSSANRTSSEHCLELSTVPKQWHIRQAIAGMFETKLLETVPLYLLFLAACGPIEFRRRIHV